MANSPDFNSLAVNHTLVCRYWVNWAPVQGWQPCLDGATRRRVSGDCRNLPRGNRICPLQGHRGWATALGHSHPLVVRCQSETAGRCRSFIFPKNTPAQTRRPSPPDVPRLAARTGGWVGTMSLTDLHSAAHPERTEGDRKSTRLN